MSERNGVPAFRNEISIGHIFLALPLFVTIASTIYWGARLEERVDSVEQLALSRIADVASRYEGHVAQENHPAGVIARISAVEASERANLTGIHKLLESMDKRMSDMANDVRLLQSELSKKEDRARGTSR